jgi:catechol 2,3-dioxygenase-like lactoylglutathione lyase family enzyme
VTRVERVDFVSVPTQNIQRAKEFYGGVLGLEENGPDEFSTGNVTLGLWEPARDGEAFAPNPAGIALRVPDVAAARGELESAGVRFKGETLDSGVCHMAFFTDPDGNWLILHRRYAGAD